MFNIQKLITRRLALKILLAFTIGAGLVMSMVIYLSIKNQRDQFREIMTTFGGEIKSLSYAGIKHPMGVGDSPSITEQLLDIRDELEGTEIVICDFNQQIVFATHENKIGTKVADFTQDREILTALTSLLRESSDSPTPTKSYFEEEVAGKRYLVTIHNIRNENECHHCHGTSREVLGGLLTRQSTEAAHTAIAELRNQTVIISVVGLGTLIAIIYLLLTRLVSTPVTRIAEKAEEIAKGNLAVSVPVRSQDSIGTLARSFNTMAHSIKDRIEYANSLREAIADPLFMVNPDMVITFMNDACVRLSGYSKEETEGQLTCSEVFNSSICESNCPLKLCFSSGQPISGIRATITNRQGEAIPIVTSTSPLKDARGNVIGAVEIIKDITLILEAERLQYVQKAAEREEEQRKYLEARAQNLLTVLSRISEGDLDVRAEQYDSDEVMDKIAHHTNETLDNLQKMYDRISSFSKELKMEVARRTIMLRERSLLLERANRELRELDRLKSSFLANMSHELRTPMNSIIGYTELMLDRIDGEINEEQEKSLLKVANNAKHLLQLINDILDMSKIESGKIELDIHETDLKELIDSVLVTMEPIIQAKNLEVKYDFPQDPPRVFVDDDKVKQIFTNLISNAVKFTDQGGITIHARPSNRNIAPGEEPLFVEICVEDSGIGIKQEDIDKLFDKFSQVDVSTSRQYEGTGLGLSIARGLIVLHKGVIWVESEYGRGTKMFLTLPAQKKVMDKCTQAIIEPALAEDLAKHFHKPVDFFLKQPTHAGKPVKCWEYNHCGQASCPAYGNEEHRCWLFAGTHCKGTEIVNIKDKPDHCKSCEIIENLILNDNPALTSDIIVGNIQATEDSTKKIVLSIDDNPEVIDLITKNIGADYTVVGMLSGKNAVEEAIKIQPAVITLDIMMPHINGWRVLQELKENPETQNIPVIILSIVDEKKTGFSLGAAEYMVKPFSKDTLLQKLKNLERLTQIRNILLIDDERETLEAMEKNLTDVDYNITAVSTPEDAERAITRRKPDIIVLNPTIRTNAFEIIELIKVHGKVNNVPLILITRSDLSEEELREFNGRIQATLNKGMMSDKDLLNELKNTIDKI